MATISSELMLAGLGVVAREGWSYDPSLIEAGTRLMGCTSKQTGAVLVPYQAS